MKLVSLFVLCFFLQGIAASSPYSYNQNFEGADQPVKFWVKGSTAKYTLDTLGVTTERAFEGAKSLKMRVTLYGDTVNPQNSTYYYWWIPLAPAPNLLDSIGVSAMLWLDSAALKYVTLCPVTSFPPTRVGGCLNPELSYPISDSAWDQIVGPKIIGNEGTVQEYVYGATRLDFGVDMIGLAILIKAAGEHQITLFVDDIRIGGRIMDPLSYESYKTTGWAAYKARIAAIVAAKRDTFNALPPIPDTTGHPLSVLGRLYYAQLLQLQPEMTKLLHEMDSITAVQNAYFAPSKMDSLNERLVEWPGLVNVLTLDLETAPQKVSLFSTDPMKYFHYTGQNFPSWITPLSTVHIRACRGEYEAAEIIVAPKKAYSAVQCVWSDFTGSSGTLPHEALDIRIAKLWYQANNPAIPSTGKGVKTLVKELLVKNDSLVKVDLSAQTNYLRMQTKDGTVFYADVSTPSAVFPDTALVYDADSLLPFALDSTATKHLWLTFHAPAGAPSGTYNGRLLLLASPAETLAQAPVSLEVLPFDLDSSRLSYSLYYEAKLTTGAVWPYSSALKDTGQLRIELRDMKEHGVLHPTCYQKTPLLGRYLAIMNELGFPQNRLYALGISTGNGQSPQELDAKKAEVAAFLDSISKYGYDTLFIYGQDEKSGPALAAQRPAWQAVHEAGAYIFVAGYNDLLDIMDTLIDFGNIAGRLQPDYATRFHLKGNQIASYGNPQVGVENPEVYRRNYGFALWKAGYDGAMDWAYQRNYGAFWNDFDNHPEHTAYREETFTYPTGNGIVSTIQWEGYREAIDDVRYLSTLLNRIDKKRKQGADVSAFEAWVESIDPSGDLSALRSDVIEKILAIESVGILRTGNSHTGAVPPLLAVRMLGGNPIVKIQFCLEEACEVDVSLRDVMGRNVVTFFHGKADAGLHSLVWNGTSGNRTKMASGVYFVQMRVNGKGVTQRRLFLCR